MINILKNEEFIKIASNINDCKFVEVGAHNGIQLDPLYELINKNNWKGILVEPDDTNFKLLKENYSNNNNVIFENICISDYDGKINFYKAPTSLHHSVEETYMNRMFKGRETIIEKDCLKLSTLLEKYNYKSIDVINVDTEGHDYTVLYDFPFDKYQPKIVRYESAHLNTEKNKKLKKILENYNYEVFTSEGKRDKIALKK